MKKATFVLLIIAILLSGTAYAESSAGYSVAFTENQTTGYVWSYRISDETVLAVTDTGYQAAESADGLVGAAGTHAWMITGLQTGEASVSFYYAWAWEEELIDPQVMYTFSSDTAGSLTLVSVEGMPEQYMSGTVIIQLSENPTTGYSWEYTADPDGIVSLIRDAYTADETDTETVGAGGVHTWVFKSNTEGTVVLTFHYARSFDANETPAAAVKLTYLVNGDLTIDFMGLDGDYELYISE